MNGNGSGNGREVVIAAAVRTAIGKGHAEKGQFRDLHPGDLLGACYAEVLDRAGVPAEEVDDVVAGCVHQIGTQQYNVARNAWLGQGLPEEIPATTVDRACGSSQQAAGFAAATIAAGQNDVVIAGGVEKMSGFAFKEAMDVQSKYGPAFSAAVMERYDMVDQGTAAEMIADRWELTREDLDEFAADSQRKAAAASEAGLFESEIVEVDGADGPVSRDQGIRPETSVEGLGKLPPVFRREEEGGRITAGSSSQISDGASALALASAERAEELGLAKRARIVDHVAVGVDPVIMLTGPIPATRKLFERNGLSADDVDRFECNEAFAPVVLAWERELGIDPERVNARGGAIALGHPVGCTGARLLTTLVQILEDEDLERGVVTMCCGGGLGTATLIERV